MSSGGHGQPASLHPPSPGNSDLMRAQAGLDPGPGLSQTLAREGVLGSNLGPSRSCDVCSALPVSCFVFPFP